MFREKIAELKLERLIIRSWLTAHPELSETLEYALAMLQYDWLDLQIAFLSVFPKLTTK
jgi:hypothetical protein